MSQYTNEAQQRLLRLITLLAGHEIVGITPAEVAHQMDVKAPTVTRDLDNLRTGGYAEQVPETGRWRLSPQIVRIATRHSVALSQAEDRLNEIKQRYGAR